MWVCRLMGPQRDVMVDANVTLLCRVWARGPGQAEWGIGMSVILGCTADCSEQHEE